MKTPLKVLSINQKNAPYYFLAPVIFIFLVFMIYPIIHSFILSFQKFENGVYSFVGFGNYMTLMQDPVFWSALKNTFIYLLVQVPCMVIMSLALAVILDQNFLRFKPLFRMALFLPSITALVAYAIVFKMLLNTEYGIINHLFQSIGMPKVDWLNTTWGARISIIMAITWRWTGYNMVIMIAGLQAIPTSLFESACIDGANAWQKLRKITIPMMKPIILFISITSTIGTLMLFDESLILTNGGPDNATITTGHHLYNSGFQFFKFGYAASISYMLVLIIAFLSFLQFKLSKRENS